MTENKVFRCHEATIINLTIVECKSKPLYDAHGHVNIINLTIVECKCLITLNISSIIRHNKSNHSGM